MNATDNTHTPSPADPIDEAFHMVVDLAPFRTLFGPALVAFAATGHGAQFLRRGEGFQSSHLLTPVEVMELACLRARYCVDGRLVVLSKRIAPHAYIRLWRTALAEIYTFKSLAAIDMVVKAVISGNQTECSKLASNAQDAKHKTFASFYPSARRLSNCAWKTADGYFSFEMDITDAHRAALLHSLWLMAECSGPVAPSLRIELRLASVSGRKVLTRTKDQAALVASVEG